MLMEIYTTKYAPPNPNEGTQIIGKFNFVLSINIGIMKKKKCRLYFHSTCFFGFISSFPSYFYLFLFKYLLHNYKYNVIAFFFLQIITDCNFENKIKIGNGKTKSVKNLRQNLPIVADIIKEPSTVLSVQMD